MDRSPALDAVRELLRAQVDAWNRGDLEAFCAHTSTDTIYVAAGGVVRGRAALIESYRRRYPDRGAMGTLALTLEDTRETVDQVTVVARWALGDGRGGVALLVFGRQDGRWVLTHDATL